MDRYPILLTIPHASTFVPVELRRHMQLTDKEIRAHSDLYTDEIYNVPKAHILKAKISRLVADPNRAPDDIEIQHQLSLDGVVISTTEHGTPIYTEPPSIEAIFERVEKYHDSFHKEIEDITPKVKFLIDGHSMLSVGPNMKSDSGKERAEISLGNRDFTTCTRDTTHKFVQFFEDKGFTVAVNDPYPGKYVLGYHCSRRGLPGIQIEINRKLYMNENTLRPYKGKIKELNEMMKELVEMVNTKIITRRENSE